MLCHEEREEEEERCWESGRAEDCLSPLQGSHILAQTPGVKTGETVSGASKTSVIITTTSARILGKASVQCAGWSCGFFNK